MGDRVDLYTAVSGIISTGMSSYGASTSTITIYGGYPDIEDIKYPCIILEPVGLLEQGDTKTVDPLRTISSKVMPVVIHIFAKRNRDLDIIADGINSAMATSSSLKGYLLNDTSDSNSFIMANEQKVKGKTLTLSFLRR